jgi:hypothetical protein
VAPDPLAWIASGRANLDTQAKLAGDLEWRRLGSIPEINWHRRRHHAPAARRRLRPPNLSRPTAACACSP